MIWLGETIEEGTPVHPDSRTTSKARGPALVPVLLAAGLVLAWACPALATNFFLTGGRSRDERRLPLPLRADVAVPEGKTLVSISYRASYDGDGEGHVTIFRTLESTIGFLGASVVELDPDAVDEGDRPYEGVLVKTVQPETPAFHAGLRPGDVLLSADGARLSNPHDFGFIVKYHDLDRPLQLRVRRGQEVFEPIIALAATTRTDQDLERHDMPALVDGHSGMVLGDLGGKIGKYFFDRGESGVLVLRVRPGMPAFYSEVRRGDVILTVDGVPVSRPGQVDALLGERAGRRTELSLRRGEELLEAVVEPVYELPEGFSFNIPIVLEWRKRPHATRFGVGWGLVGHYDRRSSVTDAGEHEQEREWGLALNLIHYESEPHEKCFSLLWFIKFRW